MSFFRRAGDSDSESSSDEEELLSSGSEDEEVAAPKQEAKPMSRFLKGAKSGDTSSEESSDEDESDEDESEDEGAPKRSRFLKGGDDEDESDEDVKKVVKSAKDKRVEEMEGIVKVLENANKINDWVAINAEFDKLVRLVQRLQSLNEPIPPVYVKTLVSLDDTLQKEKESKKKLNASNSRALNTMRQKIKKSTREWENDVTAYRKDPEAFESAAAAASAAFATPAEAAVPKPAKKVTIEPAEAAAAAAADDEGFSTVGKSGKATEEPTITTEGLFRHLSAVLEARGKKNTDRNEAVRTLEKLLKVAATPYQKIRVLLALISARFDYNPAQATYMPLDLWTSARQELDDLLALLATERQYTVQEQTEDYDDSVDRTPAGLDDVVRVRGSLVSYVDRLDDEFTRSLQNIDPHANEYVERLQDEKNLYATVARAQAYFEISGQTDATSRTVMRRLEHAYSKPDAPLQVLEQTANAELGALNSTITPVEATFSSATLIHRLCTHLYKASDSLLRTRAMLSHIYHHALHNRYHTARDMFLMSHLQENIARADVATQILFNRTVVQLGLCAFRSGLIREARDSLREIFQTGRVKELLAQGVAQQRLSTLTPEQERTEKARQLPFHLHVNLELLEAVYLVSCMLVEIPKLAAAGTTDPDAKRKILSKAFKRQLDFADRQAFTGPPENTRDHIMQASKALQNGEWEKCRDLIHGIKIWSLMPGEASVKDMLASKIQEEALRTYLFTYSTFYDNVSLSLLSSTFSLPERAVTSIVSKMIWSDELAASLDNVHHVVIFDRGVELSRLQQLAAQLVERANALVDQNEKTLQYKLDDGSGASGAPGAGGREGRAADGGAGQEGERRGGERRRGGGARGGRGGRGGRNLFAGGLGGSARRVAA